MPKEVETELLTEADYEETGLVREAKKVKVLVVDDEEIMRDFLVDVLRDEGYEVFTASDGAAALQVVDKEDIGVVITDLRLPGMDGIELLSQAKKTDPAIDVIVMTGYASVESAVESMKAGAVDYITKPLNIDHVRIVVRRTVEKRNLELKAEESEFYKKLSQLDGLTELFNYRCFQQLLAIELARSRRTRQPVSLVMIDIDNFKVFNDLNGHPAGDLALKRLSWLLKKSCRDCDFVARYGGEEFAIVLPDTNKIMGLVIAKRICQVVNKTAFEQEDALPQKKLTVVWDWPLTLTMPTIARS